MSQCLFVIKVLTYDRGLSANDRYIVLRRRLKFAISHKQASVTFVANSVIVKEIRMNVLYFWGPAIRVTGDHWLTHWELCIQPHSVVRSDLSHLQMSYQVRRGCI